MNRLTLDDTRLLLASGWLSLSEPSFAEAVLRRSRVQLLDVGEALFHAGDPSDGIYGVLSGSLAVLIAVPEFGPTMSHIILPGAWFGETAYLRGVRTVGIRATRVSRTMFLPMREIDAMMADEPRRWTTFVQLSLINQQLAIGAAYDLMIRNPLQRCAATLLRLGAFRHGPPNSSNGPVELDITQADIAHMTNMSRNSAGAILRILRDRKCIDMEYGQLVIIDPARLKLMLDPDL